MERCQGVRANGPLPAIEHPRIANSRNEAIAILERLRKFYIADFDIAGAKYIAAGIRALRRGAE